MYPLELTINTEWNIQYGIAPAILIAAIAAAAGYIKHRQNKKAQEKQNWIDQENAEKMYELQRKDALEDFNRQNEYNHPQQQMTRFRQAGLNPNLIYGNGAETTASNIRSSSINTPNHPAPESENWLSPAIEQGYTSQLQQSQNDLTTQNALVAKQQEINIQAGTAKTMQDTAKSKFDLQQATELKDSVIQKAKLENQQIQTGIQISLDRNEREKLQNTVNVEQTVQNILKTKLEQAILRQTPTLNNLEMQKKAQEIEQLKVAVENAKKEGVVKQLEADLAKDGILRSDPIWLRRMVEGLQLQGELSTFLTETPAEREKRWQSNRKSAKVYSEYDK